MSTFWKKCVDFAIQSNLEDSGEREGVKHLMEEMEGKIRSLCLEFLSPDSAHQQNSREINLVKRTTKGNFEEKSFEIKIKGNLILKPKTQFYVFLHPKEASKSFFCPLR